MQRNELDMANGSDDLDTTIGRLKSIKNANNNDDATDKENPIIIKETIIPPIPPFPSNTINIAAANNQTDRFADYLNETYQQRLRAELDVTLRINKCRQDANLLEYEMSIQLFNFLQYANSNKFGFAAGNAIDDSGNQIVNPSPVILANLEDCNLINSYFNQATRNDDLVDFGDHLQLLSNNPKIDDNLKNNFKNLFNSFLDPKTDPANPSHAIVIKHFSDEAVKINQPNKKYTLNDLENSCNKLQVKLYGKPPLSPRTKALICGVIGAILGAVIGIVVGALITAPTYGWGAVPGLMLGALKGFTLGTAIAAGTAPTLAILGATIGFFNAEKHQKNYAKTAQATTATMNNEVIDALAFTRPTPYRRTL